ncbi:MAG: peptide chain release factor N(5)-glutamine methyltransferase [Hyphomicrobium sp.]
MSAGIHLDETLGVRTALAALTRAFAAARLETPDIDARFLLQGVLGIDGARLHANPDAPLGSAAGAVRAAALRRLNREPVSRILGWREFYGRRFAITPDVLDPRPDTETLITLALDIARENGWRDRQIRFVDIGVGSGAIALTLLAEWPLARAVATDVSRAALEVTARNACVFGVEDRLTLVEARGLGGCEGAFELVVSNPPYLPTGDIERLDPEVRRYDPLLALDGGRDGVNVYREIANEIIALKFKTQIILEVGAGQADAVIEIFDGIGGTSPRTLRDIGGHVRAVALEIHW